jgi:hypothetical protein
MRNSLYFSLFVLLLLTSACSHTTNITAEQPQKTTPEQTWQRKLSTINVPVAFPVKQLEARLNKEFNGVLYKDDNIDDDNVKVTVTKIGNIGITADNNRIYFTVPVHIWAMGRWEWEPCSFCPKLSKTQATEFDMTIRTQSTVAVTESWQIKTTTTGDYSWGQQKPYIEIGPLKIPMSAVIDYALKPQVNSITARLDQELQNRIKLKDMVQNAWNTMQQPLQLNEAYSTWLLISPQEIRVTPLQCKNNEVSMRLGIKSYIETFSGAKPVVGMNPNLPKLITDPNLADNFQMGISGDISYDYATTLAKQQLNGKTFTSSDNKYSFTVNDIAISGNGSKIQVQLDMQGSSGKSKKSVKGRIFCEGTPYYDADNMTIRIKDFVYSLQTRNVLLKAANWMLGAGLESKIREQLVFPMKDKLAETQKMLQDQLTKGDRIMDNVVLKGNITNLQPEGIYLTPNTMKAVVNAEGRINLYIDKF